MSDDHNLDEQKTVISGSNDKIRPFKVGVLGHTGRMGQAVISELLKSDKLTFEIGIGRADFTKPVTLIQKFKQADILIDFTTVQTQELVYDLLLQSSLKLPLVTGVTGLAIEDQRRLETYAQQAPVFQAANFSIGIALLRKMSVLAAQALGNDFDIEIFELHHRHKLDAPSGTAYVLAEDLKQQKHNIGLNKAKLETQLSYPRSSEHIHLSAGRGGGVIGDHTVYFLGEHERLELKHSALNRSLFAAGAVKATEWCIGRSPGLYHMEHLWEA